MNEELVGFLKSQKIDKEEYLKTSYNLSSIFNELNDYIEHDLSENEKY